MARPNDKVQDLQKGYLRVSLAQAIPITNIFVNSHSKVEKLSYIQMKWINNLNSIINYKTETVYIPFRKLWMVFFFCLTCVLEQDGKIWGLVNKIVDWKRRQNGKSCQLTWKESQKSGPQVSLNFRVPRCTSDNHTWPNNTQPRNWK